MSDLDRLERRLLTTVPRAALSSCRLHYIRSLDALIDVDISIRHQLASSLFATVGIDDLLVVEENPARRVGFFDVCHVVTRVN